MRQVTRLAYQCTSRFPEYASDIIEKLLRREPENRLGNLRNGVNDVMAHPWFYEQSWDELLDGNLPVPYLPQPKALDETPSATPPHGNKKRLDLSDAMMNPSTFGFWPGW